MPRGKLKTAKQSRTAGAIRRAIGAGPNDEVNVSSRPAERLPGMPAPAAPPVDFEALRELDTIALKEMGCGAWDAPDADGKVLMLFPAEWYSSIPNGTEVVSIMDRRIFFIRGHTSRDVGFGCLAYGFRVRHRKRRPS